MDKEPYKVISLGLFTDRVVGPGIDKTFEYHEDSPWREAETFAANLNIAWNKGFTGCME